MYNINKWLDESKQSFQPPVMNKLMHGEGQLKVMYVGGPNIRSDYHIEEGEELFYMHKGSMNLKIMEKGKPRDVIIKEGELFVLPSRVPHSPQRFQDTMGLVIERERLPEEVDGLRWYTEGHAAPLYEEWFHCYDLGVQLKPVIERFYASEQKQTGRPLPGTITPNPPLQIDTSIDAGNPLLLSVWVSDNREELEATGKKSMRETGEFKIEYFYGSKGSHTEYVDWNGEVWVWQLAGTTTVKLASGLSHTLNASDSLLIPQNDSYKIDPEDGGQTMVIYIDQLANKNVQ